MKFASEIDFSANFGSAIAISEKILYNDIVSCCPDKAAQHNCEVIF